MTDDKELKDQRVPIMMTPSELEAIDDWMFKNRIRSRGEAIRRLCQIALATDGKADAIFELAATILKRRTKESERATDALEDLTKKGILSSEAILAAFGTSMDALADHARLFLAINGLFNPLGMMRATADLSEAMKHAESARAGIEDITADRKTVEAALSKYMSGAKPETRDSDNSDK